MSVSVGRETPWVWIKVAFDLGARAAFLAQFSFHLTSPNSLYYKWHVATTVPKSLFT